ncbi:unnamed protein product, partial [Ectocarpus fasciculatus]
MKKRGKLSLPRKHSSRQHQHHHGQRDDADADADTKAGNNDASPTLTFPQSSQTSPTMGFSSPAQSRRVSSRQSTAAPMDNSGRKKGSPERSRQPLPSSPWAHLSLSRKRPRPSSPWAPSASPSPAQRQREEDSTVIDLTEDPCRRRGQDNKLHEKGEERGTTEEGRLPRPPQSTAAPPRGTSPGRAIDNNDQPRRASFAEAREAGSPSAIPPPSTCLPQLPRIVMAPTAMIPTGGSTQSLATLPTAPTVAAAAAAGGRVAADNTGAEGHPRPSPRSTYVRHFEDAMATVMHARPDYACLFTAEERDVAQRFEGLSEPSKTLYVRLFQRKGPWFRADGMFAYDEVGSGTPLWVRRRNAATTADAAAAAAATAAAAAAAAAAVGEDPTPNAHVSCERRDESTAFVPPPTPFARAVGDRAVSPRADNKSATGMLSVSEDLESESVAIPIELQPDVSHPPEGVCPSTGSPPPTGTIPPAEAAEAVAAEAEAEAAEAATLAAVAEASVALTPRELTVLHGEIQSSLQELVEARFLGALPDNVGRTGPGLEAALAAVECCMRSPEIKTLLKRTGGSKKVTPTRPQAGKGSARGHQPARSGSKESRRQGTGAAAGAAPGASGGGRREMLEELRRRLAGQQTLWGVKSPLVKEIERLISASVEALGVDTATGTRCSGGCSSNTGTGVAGAGMPGKKQRCHWLVAVAGAPQLVFKRALRLMYLTCNTGALSSGRVGAASVRGAGIAGALSSWSPGLSAAFGKTRYASYVCNPQAKAFQRREEFLRWEAAVEMRCALDGAMEEIARGRQAAPAAVAAARVADGAESEEEEEEEEEEEGNGRSAERRSRTEVLVLDSDGELENVEESLTFPKEESDSLEVKLERIGKEEGRQEVQAEEDGGEEQAEMIRPAVRELEDMIAQFFSEGDDEGRTGLAAAAAVTTAVITAAATTTTDPSNSVAVAISFACSRCLHAHLETPAVALSSQVSSSPSGFDGAKKGVRGGMQEDNTLLPLLRGRCGLENAPGEAWTRPVSDTTTEEVDQKGAGTYAGHAERSCSRQQQQQEDGRCGPALLTHAGESRHGESNAASKLLSVTAADCASGGGPTPDFAPVGEQMVAAKGSGTEEGKEVVSINNGVPEFLLQLEAGWVLASAVWEGVPLLERARDYEGAVELLIQLLATRYTPHRRGRWWNRLSLDLAHAKRLPCALWASQEGLRDPQVRGGDRLALEKRTSMLSARAFNKKKVSTSSKTAASQLAPPALLVSDLSSVKSPKRQTLEERTIGYRSGGESSGGNDGGVNSDDDQDDVFEDPAVERARARAQKKKEQKERQRRRQRQQCPVPASGSSSSCKHAEKGAAPVMAGTSTRSTNSESSGILNLDGNSGSGGFQAAVGAGGDTRRGGGGIEKKPDPEIAREATATAVVAAAAVARTLRCEGVAELSQVPNLFDDESIAGVVLAATAASEVATAIVGGAENDARVGVPEISITGRRLNREV